MNNLPPPKNDEKQKKQKKKQKLETNIDYNIVVTIPPSFFQKQKMKHHINHSLRTYMPWIIQMFEE